MNLAKLLLSSTLHVACAAAVAAAELEEVLVIGVTPTEGIGLDPAKLAAHVRSAVAEELRASQSLDLTDYMSRNLGSVSINSAQNNPLQPDVQFRGFTASPLLGLPQGLAVYQDGARINEPFGDAVNWDLLALSAVHSISLVAGANPLYGLNSLGGALTIDMKNGFNYQGHAAEVSGGAWERVRIDGESGANDGTLGYYVNVQYFEEQGWRDLSDSDALNLFGAVSWQAERSSFDLSGAYAESDLRGNGPLPVGQIAVARDSVFTAPDITENTLYMFTAEAEHYVSDEWQVSGSAFYRNLDTRSFNGDAGEFAECELGNGDRLLEGLEEDDLEALGLDTEDVCAGAVHADADALEVFLNDLAGADVFELEDLTDDLSGTGVLADDAINNSSGRDQESWGGDVVVTSIAQWFGHESHFIAGFGYFDGDSGFDAVVELAELDEDTRSTEGLGTGTFVDDLTTRVRTSNRSWSVYLSDTLSLTGAIAVTLAGRYNDTDVSIRDRSGERPELDGDHDFDRFNPAVGVTIQVLPAVNLYGSYAESARAPTAIELSCNADVFEIARANAVAAGEDPDDVEFECRLPNAFLADPPLDQVVAKSFEAGARGAVRESTHYHLGFFHTVNHDDIIFQSTGRATGLFANVEETRRLGVEVELDGRWLELQWFANYSYVRATFEDAFEVLSPNHPLADADGEVEVESGNRIPGIPAHQFKFGADWTFANGLSLGGDLLVNSKQYLRGDEANALPRVDGYAVVNLRARYRFGKRFEWFARLDNVFDADYENFGLLGEDPSEVLPDLTDTRPYFLGVGAPRAGWVGLRVSL
jgi:outer membrane receptor protein involved in Fe transport